MFSLGATVAAMMFGYWLGRVQDKIVTKIESWFWKRRPRKLFRASSRAFDKEFAADTLQWGCEHCKNCSWWAKDFPSHFAHAAVWHVYDVRSRGPYGPPDRCVSTTKSGLGAWTRAHKEGRREHFYVLENVDQNCIIDMHQLVHVSWFKSFCQQCLEAEIADKKDVQCITEDVKVWADVLKEVVLDRTTLPHAVTVRRVERLNLLQRLAVYLDWDMLFTLLV